MWKGDLDRSEEDAVNTRLQEVYFDVREENFDLTEGDAIFAIIEDVDKRRHTPI